MALVKRAQKLYEKSFRQLQRTGMEKNGSTNYMFAGKPIVASYSGYPSMIDEARSGSYVPAGDVKALMNEIQHYSSLSKEEY